MTKISDRTKQERAKYLVRLARALYESAAHEFDNEQLEQHRLVAVQLARLIDDVAENDHTLRPDLGLEMVLFVELKMSKKNTKEAEPFRQAVLSYIEEDEKIFDAEQSKINDTNSTTNR